jgi:hypothetical protein
MSRHRAAKVCRVSANPGAVVVRSARERRAGVCSALAPVLAPGSALGVLLSRALSSAQVNIVCSALTHFTQPPVNRVWPLLDAHAPPPACGRARRRSLSPARSAYRPTSHNPARYAGAHCSNSPHAMKFDIEPHRTKTPPLAVRTRVSSCRASARASRSIAGNTGSSEHASRPSAG